MSQFKIIVLSFFSLLLSFTCNGATITVTASDSLAIFNGECSLSEAIVNANTDTQVYGECAAGNGVDTIILTKDVTIMAVYESHGVYGRTGTPTIQTEIILDGNGFTLSRDYSLICTLNQIDATGEFRLLRTEGVNLTLQNITLANGCADGVGIDLRRNGGAIFNDGDLTTINVVFQQNQAFNEGGGIFHESGTIELISNSTFVDNSAQNGGAITNISPIDSILNSTFLRNSSSGDGGAIFNSNSSISAIINSTFSENSAPVSGGAISNELSSIASILNSTFSGNTANFGGAISNLNSTITALNNSLFHNNSTTDCDFIDDLNGSNNITDNPISLCPGLIVASLRNTSIKPIADNGGPTMTHALLEGSEAIDVADTLTNTGTATITDQRGVAAVGIRDIGAFEFVTIFSQCPIALQVDGFITTVSNNNELIEAMECSNVNGNIQDSINLSQDITLSFEYENDGAYGRTGTPAINSRLILDGNGFILLRNNSLNCVLDETGTEDEFRLLRTTSNADLILQNITLVNGCADGTGLHRNGGGLFNEGDLTITNTVFKQNHAYIAGGGIYHDNGSLELISNSLFVSNYAINAGGAILNESSIGRIENTTFSENSSALGGAIFNSDSAIDFILNSTFSGNTANSGSAINGLFDTFPFTINNSLFHNNGGSDCGSLSGAFTGNNNISDNLSSGCPGLIPTTLSSNSVASLANNGGATMTHALLLGSEAIDTSDTITNTGTATSVDQRGIVANGIRDIGAHEFHAIFDLCPTALKIDGFITTVIDAMELIEAIECSNVNGSSRDTIYLSQDITLITEYENDGVYGRTGTPAIEEQMLLDGNGFTIMRDNSLSCDLDEIATNSEFRLLRTTQSADLILQNITLENGCADGTGAQQNGGGLYNDADLTIINTSFIQNQASSDGGGILHHLGNLDLIRNSIFTENSANYGGAIGNLNSIDNIENSMFSGNSASIEGGGIYNYESSIGTILNSTFSGNLARAIISEDSSIGTIINSTFSENPEGAIINISSTINTILNSTFSGNSALRGGAIYNLNGSVIDSILNCTFVDNSSPYGAAIYNNKSTIVALNNSLFNRNAFYECSSTESLFNGSNNISDSTLGGCPGMIPITLIGGRVAPLADNGGPTMTHALLDGSEAIDKSDTVTNTGTATSMDQRGVVTLGIRDIGAYESDFIPCSLALQVDGFTTTVSNDVELVQAMVCSKLNGTTRDNIIFSQDIILTTEYENNTYSGRTGTPLINTPMLLDGNGFKLVRDNSLNCNLDGISTEGEFRLLHTSGHADMTLQNITLANGCADGTGSQGNGGGLFNEADITIINTVVKQNQASNYGGGVIHKQGTFALISNSAFVNNTAKNGGGINTQGGPITSIENSTFSGNSASTHGGAIFSQSTSIGTIINSTFSGNSASASGGAVYNVIAEIGAILNSTFSGNSAQDGGAIFSASSTITALNNSLFHNNGNTDCDSSFSTFNGSNNISDSPSGGCPGLIPTTLSSNSVAPLADNGGPTMTHALLVGSQAIDAADTVTNTGTATSTDQRGFAAFSNRDIGAYEFGVTPCALALQVDGFITTVNNSVELVEAMRCTNLNGMNRDVINLSQNITLTSLYENNGVYGRTGTPPIHTPMLLDGKGYSLVRDDSLNCDLNEIATNSEFRLLRTTQSADLILQDVTLANGCADGINSQRNGGGIYNDADLTITNVTFKQNQSRWDGGGVFHGSGTLELILNSTFVENSAENGGGIANLHSMGIIENSTFSGNLAFSVGGAISNYQSSISAILNNTFSGNSAQSGGAIYNVNSTITALNNSLFHNNNNADCGNSNGTFNGDNNISDNPSSGCQGLIPTTLSSNSVIPLADNGGPTMTHALLVDSEAIDAADTVSNTGTAISTDQRGFATDNIRDIGAYEVQVPVVTAPADIMMEATDATTAISLGSATVVDIDEAGLSSSADITGPFVVGVHTINWSATDSQGHVGSAIQIVTITDNIEPTITLNDSASVLIVIGGSYVAGATANDLVDGDLTSSIITGGNTVDVNTAGIYVVTYTVTDQANNTAQTVQTVNVQASVQVTVSGLHANGFVDLTSNGQILMFTNNGTSSFGPFDNGTVYAASIISQPTTPNQTCVITGGSNNDGSGVIAGNNVELSVTCTTNVYFIGGMTTGLIPDNNLVLQNNLGDDLLITDDGAFVFATAIEDLQSYDISIFLQPDDPIQNCSLSNTGGNIAGADVIDVSIDCEFGDDLIYRHGFEDTQAITTFNMKLID